MNKPRMKLAIKILEEYHINGMPFDYTVFGAQTKCGTIACAAGLIALDPNTDLETTWNSSDDLVILFEGQRQEIALAKWLNIPKDISYKIFITGDEFYRDIYDTDITALHVSDLLRYYLNHEYLPAESSLSLIRV